eukprot:scaffold5411_cov60-Attheya_sp.AAC.1
MWVYKYGASEDGEKKHDTTNEAKTRRGSHFQVIASLPFLRNGHPDPFLRNAFLKEASRIPYVLWRARNRAARALESFFFFLAGGWNMSIANYPLPRAQVAMTLEQRRKVRHAQLIEAPLLPNDDNE